MDFDGKTTIAGEKVILNDQTKSELLLVNPRNYDNYFSIDAINIKGNNLIVEVYDISGQLINSKIINNNEDSYRITISTHELKGLFFVRINDGIYSATHKNVK